MATYNLGRVVGAMIYTGTNTADVTSPHDGDLYINTSSYDLLQYNGTAWTSIGNIKGATGEKGDTGDAGATGATGATGAQGPQGDPGEDGNGIENIYINDSGDLVVDLTRDITEG